MNLNHPAFRMVIATIASIALSVLILATPMPFIHKIMVGIPLNALLGAFCMAGAKL